MDDNGAVENLQVKGWLGGDWGGKLAGRENLFQVCMALAVEADVLAKAAEIDFAQARVLAQKRKVGRIEGKAVNGGHGLRVLVLETDSAKVDAGEPADGPGVDGQSAVDALVNLPQG